MRYKNAGIALGLAAVAITILVLAFSRKPPAPIPVAQAESHAENHIAKIDEVRQDEIAEQRDIARTEKMAAEKRNSPECQFWKKQNESKPNKRNEEKITQYCELAQAQ